jgi:DeoR family deoxyribose operon repressor
MNEVLNGRQKQVAELVRGFHFMTIKQLAEKLQVSEMTVRRDIQVLAENNLINQVFGGVTAPGTAEGEKNYSLVQAQSHNMSLKIKIAQKARELLASDEVVFFDSGTTVQALAEQLPPDSALTIISSSFNSLEVLVKLPNCTVISGGGVYAIKPKVFFDHDSGVFFRRYRANKAFIGTTGFELNLGLTCGYTEDVPLKQAMLESSKEKILLTDSTKFGKVSTCLFGKIEDFTTVITDSGIPDEYAQYIRSCGVEVVIVS